MPAKKLPKKIVKELNKSVMFNIFGLVNVKAIKSRTGSRLGVETLKKLIQERFGKEMATGEVAFTK